MKLIESEVRILNHVLNQLISDFAVACSYSLIGIALQVAFYLRIKLVDLLYGLIVKGIRVKHTAHKTLIGDILNWVLAVVVVVLQKGIISLTIAAGHLNSSHSCTVCHMANQARINCVHQILAISHTIVIEVIALIFIV